ncbi:hypothetical protein H0H87_006093 [Tephrocybe sp. NHM501043]|nr:hypothetical protein H0H87_006093 [Tephrocybe sp. NHM501043]
MFNRAVLFVAAIIVQLSLATEGQTLMSEDISLPYPVKSCPPGYHHGWEVLALQFTGVSAEIFMKKTGSFFDSAWYAGEIIETTGEDNTVGATRTSVDPGDEPVTERLTDYHTSAPEAWSMRLVLENAPVTIAGIKLASYDEIFSAQSICGGAATYYTMTAAYCSDRVIQGYSMFDAYRRSAVAGLAKEIGADVFEGTCPSV